MYPGDPGPPGGDFAGLILRQTPSTTSSLGVGDAVFGLAGGCLGSHVVASSKALAPLPSHVDFTEAATMPTVFVTADLALNRLAALQPGQRVLVHAAAGGVGLAALQVIAAAKGVAVVTAGGPLKRTLLRSLGAGHVGSSRDTTFGESALLADGGGVDVVLNTLTSSGMIAASLALVNRGGHFVEISKRDIFSAARVAQGRTHLN
jgi:NADPH:quinone reductase-like Zn-dependent oxidoreductase